MKVAFCTGWGVEKDGIADYSSHLVEGLKAINVETEIIKLGYYINEPAYYKQAAERANLCDLCHVQFNYVYFNGELPYRNRFIYFSSHLTKPLLMTVHEVRAKLNLISTGFDNNFNRFIYNGALLLLNYWSRNYHRKMYNRPDKIFAHTEGQARLIRSLTDRPEKVLLIPHGVPEIDERKRKMFSAQAKEVLGLKGKIVLGIFGFINSRKGYEIVFDVLPQLPNNVVLLIAGGKMTEFVTDIQYYGRLIKSIEERKIKDKVKITGYLKPLDIAMAMAATDICLAPFPPGTASGALSLCIGYHKSIVASDIAANREINSGVPCLELFQEENREDLKKKIFGLLNNKDRIVELINLTKDYSGKFSFLRIAKDTAKIYKELLKCR